MFGFLSYGYYKFLAPAKPLWLVDGPFPYGKERKRERERKESGAKKRERKRERAVLLSLLLYACAHACIIREDQTAVPPQGGQLSGPLFS